MAAAEGEGSMWNAGSWHWETKSFTKAMVGMITDGLGAIRVTSNGLVGTIRKVIEVTGGAEINIRKGKKLPVFELAFKAEYGITAADTAKPEMGKLHIFEVYQDDVSEDFEVHFATTSASSAVDALGGSRALRTGLLSDAVRRVIRDFAAKLPDMDGGEAALAEIKKRRAEEAEVAKRAAEIAAVEAQLRDKQEASERAARAAAEAHQLEMRAAATAAARATGGSASEAAMTASASSAESGAGVGEVAGKASVWNAGAYHWEERNLTAWAHGRLREILLGIEVDVPGGALNISEVRSLQGDASSSSRKGSQIVVFELKLALAWEGEIVDKDGNVKACGDGQVEIPQFDQDDDLDCIEISIKAASKAREDEGLGRQMKLCGEPAIRDALKQFVAELRAK